MGTFHHRKRATFEGCLFGFFLGCFVTATGFLFLKSHDYNYLDENAAIQPTDNAKTDRTPETSKLIKAVDCKFHHAQSDPNEGMEDPSKFIEKIEPNFWIALHEQQFDYVRWEIMKTGVYYETQITEQFKKILYGKPKGIVVDVGMNIGWFTLYSRAMGHNVVAFDPNPIMHSRVCNSLKLNKWWDDTSNDSSDKSGVTTFAYGLGDQTSTLNLTMHAQNPGASSLINNWIRRNAQGTLEVPVSTLDAVAAQLGWIQVQVQGQEQEPQRERDDSRTIHLLKVDCEGYEPFIFRGGSALLNSGIVQNILMESTPRRRAEEVLEMFTTLYKAGYFVEHLSLFADKDSNMNETKDKLNEHLRNGDFEGSETHTFFSYKKVDMWWKRRTDP